MWVYLSRHIPGLFITEMYLLVVAAGIFTEVCSIFHTCLKGFKSVTIGIPGSQVNVTEISSVSPAHDIGVVLSCWKMSPMPLETHGNHKGV